jgi:hypothetical protein
MIKVIQDFPNYTISSCGVVTNTKTGKIKSLILGKNGYYAIHLYHNGACRREYLHRLLCKHFKPNPDNKRTVNHIDGNKLNNNLSNLEWSTDSENIKHAHDTGLNKGSSKVTEDHLKQIYKRFFNGESLTAISKDFPYNNVTVSNHFTKYINKLGEQDKRSVQERLNKLSRAKSSGLTKRVVIKLQMVCIKTNTVLKTFSCIKEAKDFLQVKSSGPISNVLKGRQKTAYGYFWKID